MSKKRKVEEDNEQLQNECRKLEDERQKLLKDIEKLKSDKSNFTSMSKQQQEHVADTPTKEDYDSGIK